MTPARQGSSISLRLAGGFFLLLAVLGGALLVTLYNMKQVKIATEELTDRQEIRRMALEIGDIAEELFARQQEFVDAEDFNVDFVIDFRACYDNMEEKLRALLARRMGEPERTYLADLEQAVLQMRRVFIEQIVPAKTNAITGERPSEELSGPVGQSRAVLGKIRKLNDQLAAMFEARLYYAENRSSGAWDVSVAVWQITFPFALLMSLLVIYYTHRAIVRPVGALLDGTNALASGQLGADLQIKGSREFQELAQAFNDMARALEANQKRLVEAEKMASVGRLAAGVAHEINNPLTVILGYADMLRSSLPEPAAEREQLQIIADEARQCKAIVDSLLDLSRPHDSTPGEVINPNDVITEVLGMVQALQLTDGIRIKESVISRPLPLSISRSRLRQLALNVVRNALEALRGFEDGVLRVAGYVRPNAKLDQARLKDANSAARSFLVLVVTDNGPGIRAEDLERLFEPFFTTKTDGIGLGLAISYNIARAHGGYISVESEGGEGTTFTVALPLTEQA